MNKIVNKTDMKNAYGAKQLLTPAIEALQKITHQALGSSVEAHEKLTHFRAWLQEFASEADAVIRQGNSQYAERPQELIDAACMRLHKLPDEILLREKRTQAANKNYEAQVAELKSKGFTSGQIAKIVDDSSPEIERNENEITALNNERDHILAFLADAPVFNTDLLKGTALETFQQQDLAD
jgi:hypothetical protein